MAETFSREVLHITGILETFLATINIFPEEGVHHLRMEPHIKMTMEKLKIKNGGYLGQ